MDQRRLLLFFLICFLLITVFGPKPKPPQKALPANQEEAAQAENAENVELAVDTAEDEPKDDQTEETVQLEEVDAELEYVTLGSLDSDSPYRLLATFTSEGAGVRRLELNSPRFRDLHDRGGYMGHLELTKDAKEGLRVQALGAGTPAAAAGLQVGDRILSFNSGNGQQLPLSSIVQIPVLLEECKPGQEITLQIARGDRSAVDKVVKLTRRPLEIIRPEIENVLMRGEQLPQMVISPPSFQFTFETLNQDRLPTEEAMREAMLAVKAGELSPVIDKELAGLALRTSNWEISARDETSVTFRKIVQRYNLEVFKHYYLTPVPETEQDNKNYPGYHLALDIEVRNLGGSDLSLRYRLDGPNGLPLEGWWYANKVSREWSTSGIRDLIVKNVGNEVAQYSPTAIAANEVDTTQGRPLAFAGVDSQYFSAVLMPKKPSLEVAWIDELRAISLSPKPKGRSVEGRYVNATCRLISHPIDLAANESFKHTYDIFVGPKRPELLQQYQVNESKQNGLDNLLYYGWFGWASRPMLGILHFFYGIVGNYGIAIVMLTVLVRGGMFPISRKQSQSMAKMQELRPEMDKIKEKYKQDLQKQSQATQELYRKHNINPLAGCLPLFIQMPIFMGLYRALMVDVELRQAPLLGDTIRWCSNLAAPDMLYDWSSFMPNFVTAGETAIVGMGPFLNLLPLITAGLFLLQQKLFMPEPANEQAAMQQNIMKYMMFIMAFLFFKVAAGLCLYFIASSIWGIIERKMLPKPPMNGALATADGPSTTGGSLYNGSSDKRKNSSSNRNKKKSSKKKKR